jgi:predicted small secreted protein
MAALFAVVLAGCNTVQGMARMSKSGAAIQRSAKKHGKIHTQGRLGRAA